MTGARIAIEAPVPADFRALLNAAGLDEPRRLPTWGPASDAP